jgi:signal transduction histidine kinase/ligand-binding sensor domain-containing protein
MVALFRFIPVLFFFCLLLLFPARAQHLNIRSYQMNQFMGLPSVFHSIQDTDGFRWFGTETGVVRFDGSNFHRFTLEDGLSDNEVLKIFEDSRKRIWFITFNGHLSYYYKGRFYNAANSALLKRIGAISTFSFVQEDNLGGILFSGGQNKILYIGPDNEVRQYNLEKSEYPIGSSIFYADARGRQYLVCNRGFFPFDQGRLQPSRFRYSPIHVTAYHAPRDGELYFVAREGLVRMQDTVQQLIIPHHQLPTTSQVNQLFIDSSRRLWLEAKGAGVYVLENFPTAGTNFKLYLKGTFISSISEDREANLWFTTSGEGIYILPGNSAKTLAITKEEGLPNNKINAIARDSRGTIWLGLDKGKVARYHQGQIREYDINFTDNFSRVTYLLVDRQDNIWCATDHGVVQLQKQPQDKYKIVRKLYHLDKRHYAVKSLQLDKAGDVTFVQSAGIEKFIDQVDSLGYFVARIPEVERMRTFTHYYDQRGSLWFGNLKGLHQIGPDNRKINLWQSHPALTYRITSIKELPGGILALATYGHGIIFIKQGRVLSQMTKKDGLSSNICRRLFVRHNTIWVATNEGVNRFTFAQGAATPVAVFRTTDGLLSDDILDVLVDKDKVYVGTSLGLNILPDLKQRPRQLPPPIQLTAVMVEGRNLSRQVNPKLPHQQNRIQFGFIGITFQDAKNITYQYRLKEINPAWTSTPNTTLEFSALQPGSYTFEVRAQKQHSAWSPPLRYTFVITPPFWRTWWFLCLLAVLATILIVIFTRLYIAGKLRQQMRRLETDYRIQQERERIARDLHDNVGSHLAYIINSLEETPGQAGVANAGHTSDLREFTKQTITQLRETIWAIRQETISVQELGTKIQKLIWQVSSHRPDFEYEVTIEGNQESQLTPVQALNLFRIAQEAVNNVFKHSQSNCLFVTLKVVREEYLEITIEDRGQGFDVAARRTEDHYGLLNLQERARELEASFKINSVPGMGTLIYLKVHLK